MSAAHELRLRLHSMYAADREMLSTLEQAPDRAAWFQARAVGVVAHTYHVWWDPKLQQQIGRAGREGRLAASQVCDFNLPIAADPLLPRGIMGDGVIDFPTITRWVAAAGYRGPVEVEILSADSWASDGDDVLARLKQRWLTLVLPFPSGDG